MKKLFRRLMCMIQGHDYPCPFFSGDTLCFCRRCGQEVAGRTFADLDPSDRDLSEWDEAA